jgi:hypothetical protein
MYYNLRVGLRPGIAPCTLECAAFVPTSFIRICQRVVRPALLKQLIYLPGFTQYRILLSSWATQIGNKESTLFRRSNLH